jgi:hypothetical protein
MRYVDLTIQTLIMLFALGFLIYTYGEGDWPMSILIAQMILGPWQMTSSFVSIIAKADLWKSKRIHFLISCCYLLFIYACVNVTIPELKPSGIIFGLLLTIPAWSLALFYYVITWSTVFPRKKNRGSFLPNLSF